MIPSDDPNRTVPRNNTPAPADDTNSRAADESSADPNHTVDHAQAETPAGMGTVARTPSDVARLEESAQKHAAQGVPGYVLLRELGRGGMGVVYAARHAKLDHVVALKMLLGEARTDRADVIRFLAEAQAVAAIKHENVVQVYDYGESDGRPFMALEFCPGGTLSGLLKGGESVSSTSSARDASKLLTQVARGVAAAHALGIVHRDLKPGNVFLDAAGAPKVADFGLAKRGEGADVTQVGQGMGTPAYMAPEQARDAKFVGPQADVWALGVMLYQALTGERPFTGTVQEILAKAQNTEPLPPRKVVSTVPRDLELICLKCLSKQPHERYATAKELADDLDRYARGEPVSVRPAGPLERAYKAVMRNKVVSAAAAAVFLALSIGLGFSIYYAREASEQAYDAGQKKQQADEAAGREATERIRADGKAADADRERREAVAARNDFKRANDELSLANGKVTAAVARMLLTPLRPDGLNRPLAPAEIDAFWQLASFRDTPVKSRFLAEAVASPLGATQLATRAPYALHAAIGLDRAGWTAAQQLLLSKMNAPDLPTDQRADFAITLSYSEPLPPDAEQVARVLAEDIKTSTSLQVLAFLGERLAEVTRSVPPRTAAELCEPAAARLLAAMDSQKFGDPLVLMPLARAASALSERMEAGAAAALLVAAILKPRDADLFVARLDLAAGLSDTAGRMEAGAGAAVLLDTLEKTDDRAARSTLLRGLEKYAARFDAGTAERTARSVLAGWKKDRKTDNLRATIQTLRALLGQTDRPIQEAVASEATGLMVAEMKAAPDPYSGTQFAFAAAEIASQMEPGAAADLCAGAAKILIDALTGAEEPGICGQCARALAAVAARMEPRAADRVCRDAAKRLARRLAPAPDPFLLADLAAGLGAVTARTDRREPVAECADAARALKAAMANVRDPMLLANLAMSLGIVTARVDQRTADEGYAAAAKMLAAAIKNPGNPRAVPALAPALAAVTGQMRPAVAAAMCGEAAQSLADILASGGDWTRQLDLVRGMRALATRLPPDAATELFLNATGSVTDAMAANDLNQGLVFALRGLSAEPLKRATGDVARAVGAFVGPGAPLVGATTLTQFSPPEPPPAQTLVNLLNHPFCVGEARRAVLDALGVTYKRNFKDQWEFVEYAQKHQTQLNLFKTPPQPKPARPVEVKPPLGTPFNDF